MKKIAVILFSGLLLVTCEESSPGDDHSIHTGHVSDTSAGTMNAQGMHHEETDHSNMIVLTEREQMLAGIKLDSVRYNSLGDEITVLGVTAIDEQHTASIAARTDGRIEKLYVRNEGADITVGTPLFNIYSEAIIAGEVDLIQLLESNAEPGLITAAEEKLFLLGMSRAQIAGVRKNRTTLRTITVYGETHGYVASLGIHEGQYVSKGDILFEVGSLNTVRINVQLYPGEVAMLTDSTTFFVGDSLLPATTLFRNPALEENSTVYNVFLRADNPGHRLRPGMMVMVTITTKKENVLSVPRTSVLEEQGMRFVWVQEPDGMFNRRMISTGKEDGKYMEITEGLREGDFVVVSGIYLLNSEFILRKGGSTMAGMEM